jgi:hypothetical protein
VQLKQVKRLDYENEYEEVGYLPPRAKPFVGPLKVGDYVEISDHGYIRAKYRIAVDNGAKGSGLCPGLFD